MAGAALADGGLSAAERFGADAIQAARHALRDIPAHDVDIAGVPVRLRVARGTVADRLLPSLAMHPAATAPPRLEILAIDDASAGGPPPPPPWRHGDYLPGDAVAGTEDAAYNLEYGILSLFDRATRTGLYWARDATRLPRWETVHPLRALLHWALEDRVFMHAAPVAAGGSGALLIGPGGSGKSTTVLAAAERGLAIGGDDYCLLEPGPRPRAHALYGFAKLRSDGVARLPATAARRVEVPGDGEPGDVVVAVDVAPNLPVDALVLPRVTGGDTPLLVPIGPGEALRALGPSTAFQLPGARRDAFAALAELVRSVPAYRLELTHDLDAIVARLRALLEGGC